MKKKYACFTNNNNRKVIRREHRSDESGMSDTNWVFWLKYISIYKKFYISPSNRFLSVHFFSTFDVDLLWNVFLSYLRSPVFSSHFRSFFFCVFFSLLDQFFGKTSATSLQNRISSVYTTSIFFQWTQKNKR